MFNAYPEALSSAVQFEAIEGVTEMMNNEGTALRFPDEVAFVNVKAEGQAPDGMVVHDFRSLLADTGFSLTRIISTEASTLIECHPV